MCHSQINECSRPFREADQRKWSFSGCWNWSGPAKVRLSCAVLSHWFLPARNKNRFCRKQEKVVFDKMCFTNRKRTQSVGSHSRLKKKLAKGWIAFERRKWRAKRAEIFCMKNVVCMKKSTSFLRRTHPVRTQDKLSNLNPLTMGLNHILCKRN